MNDNIRIGSFQGSIVDNDFECNLNKVKEVLNQTRDKGLDFLCFPETYLSGYSEQAVRESSIPMDDPCLLEFIRFSTAFDAVILVGMSERDNDKIFNTQIVVYRGKVQGGNRFMFGTNAPPTSCPVSSWLESIISPTRTRIISSAIPL